MPVRTVYDELEQAMYGAGIGDGDYRTGAARGEGDVRRALETVRLMNTGQLNKFSKQRGGGTALMDFLDVNRAPEPIVYPAVADALASRSTRERVLLSLESGSLESGSLVWFACVLREYDRLGDLSMDGRPKMRGADARHLALTRRQVDKVRASSRVAAMI